MKIYKQIKLEEEIELQKNYSTKHVDFPKKTYLYTSTYTFAFDSQQS